MVTTQEHLGEPLTGPPTTEKPEGPIAAAMLAAGLGAVALGFLTVLAEASSRAKDWLQFNDRVGPLSGKTLIALLAWLASWLVLHLIYRNRPFETVRALTITLVLIGIGLLGTFPIFFQAFE